MKGVWGYFHNFLCPPPACNDFTDMSWDIPARSRNCNWWSKLKALGRRRSWLASATPYQNMLSSGGRLGSTCCRYGWLFFNAAGWPRLVLTTRLLSDWTAVAYTVRKDLRQTNHIHCIIMMLFFRKWCWFKFSTALWSNSARVLSHWIWQLLPGRKAINLKF